jgi:hypothetical protein
MSECLATRPAHTYVDPTVDGHVLLVNIAANEMDSAVIRLTPANAAKLGQMLISVANRMQSSP